MYSSWIFRIGPIILVLLMLSSGHTSRPTTFIDDHELDDSNAHRQQPSPASSTTNSHSSPLKNDDHLLFVRIVSGPRYDLDHPKYPVSDYLRLLTRATHMLHPPSASLRPLTLVSLDPPPSPNRSPLAFHMENSPPYSLTNKEALQVLDHILKGLERTIPTGWIHVYDFAVFKDVRIFSEARGGFFPYGHSTSRLVYI